MIILKKISDFIVYEYESVFRALEKINQNKNRIVFVVSSSGQLLGSFTDGDFRRWLINVENFDLKQDVGSLTNANAQSLPIEASRKEIENSFKRPISVIPLLDDSKRPVAIAIKGERGIVLGLQKIDESSPAFIIAEIGNNHNGSLELAKKLIKLAKKAGADCAKFQMRSMNSLYKESADGSSDLGTEYTLDLLSRFQLSDEELFSAFDYCKELDMMPLCTPWDTESLRKLENYGMNAYKVASADLTNDALLTDIAKTGKTLICSTGMSKESEIRHAVDLLKYHGTEFIMLHCNSTYPTPLKDVNLKYLQRLKSITGSIVGYSGHERGITIPIAAVALGAKVIEKHFTIDKEMEGNDHKVSLLPDEFKQMVQDIRVLESALGNNDSRLLSQGEMINREILAKSLVSNTNIPKGSTITREMLDVKSPGQGLQPCYLEQLVGMKSKRDMSPGDYFYNSDLKSLESSPKAYKFDRPFGIPVRYHDYKKLTALSNMDFIEFHLSYQDMEVNIADFIKPTANHGFAVHSPELFKGDHILNLASPDTEYRKHSIEELTRVVEITRELKGFFPNTKKPFIVVNAGGFNTQGFVDKDALPSMYNRVAESLSEINTEGVEIIIQTMPPFPWHFGGQSFHNLFVSANDIATFCKQNNIRICLDVSHSMMACNYYDWDLIEFIRTIRPYIAYCHIVDAKGVDGEGIQIGHGDVNFSDLSKVLKEQVSSIPFIPEVWQGHKNNGEGFWEALSYLERYF
ncbi:N-acetylneuraminate synthase family protein [Neptuniibacter sp. QD72_48]|uniref:N-acetylneuraminate synthase family protein n=1 Tax=unclassified Neptuniibacter TaxID=2630693 RepID=UPI0039F4E07B